MKLWIGLFAATCMALTGCGSDSDSTSSAQDVAAAPADGVSGLDGSTDASTPAPDAAPGPGSDAGTGSGEDAGSTPTDSVATEDTSVIDPPAGVVCPSAHFMELSDVDGPGPGYDMPWIDVSCDEETVTVLSNGLPHYMFQPMTPNALQTQDFNWTFPLYPEVAAERTDIPLLGTVGMAINGCPIYGPNEGPFPDPFGDPIYNDIMDWNQGHTGGNGDYHFHALLTSTFYPDYVDGEVSPIIGYGLDGFPIYGPYGCVDSDCAEVLKFESSWEVTGDPTTYAWDNHDCLAASCDEAAGNMLDRCNGRVGPDGTYRYHATDGFPYLLGCYSGSAAEAGDTGVPGRGEPPAGGGPQSCEQEADCVGQCPEGSMGCTCHTTPMNTQLCVPTCNSADDCPTDMNGGAMNCAGAGVCVPAGGPPGGAP
jgi:hypothetical protein